MSFANNSTAQFKKISLRKKTDSTPSPTRLVLTFSICCMNQYTWMERYCGIPVSIVHKCKLNISELLKNNNTFKSKAKELQRMLCLFLTALYEWPRNFCDSSVCHYTWRWSHWNYKQLPRQFEVIQFISSSWKIYILAPKKKAMLNKCLNFRIFLIRYKIKSEGHSVHAVKYIEEMRISL